MTHPTKFLSFATFSEAMQAGYIPARARLISSDNHRIAVRIVDCSRGTGCGYDFAVAVVADDEYPFREQFGPFAKSHTVSLTGEPNKQGTRGCFCAMFHSVELADGIEAAKLAMKKMSEARGSMLEQIEGENHGKKN